jgi:hypothetical protein
LLQLDEDWEFNNQTPNCIIQTSEETIVDNVDKPIANLKILNMQRKKTTKEKTIAEFENKLVANLKTRREGHALDRCYSSTNQRLAIKRA